MRHNPMYSLRHKKTRSEFAKVGLGRAMKKLRSTVADYQRTVNGSLCWCYVGIKMLAKDVT